MMTLSEDRAAFLTLLDLAATDTQLALLAEVDDPGCWPSRAATGIASCWPGTRTCRPTRSPRWPGWTTRRSTRA